jgi:hypothetical protein
MSLDRMLRGEVAEAVQRILDRHMARALEHGFDVPEWWGDLGTALEHASRRRFTDQPPISGSGGAPALFGWVTVRAAAGLTGLSEGHIRALARAGQVRCLRAGARTWMIDPTSLPTPIGH